MTPPFEGQFIIWSFYLTSVVLVAGDVIGKWRRRNRRVHKRVGVKDALTMGVMQAVAILPGLSRSGSTISAGVASGLTRKRAADFSFLMSIPAILGSLVLELKGVVLDGEPIGDITLVPTLLGVLAAAVFGFIAIKGMLKLIRRVSMKWFALYTFLLGTFLLLDKFVFQDLDDLSAYSARRRQALFLYNATTKEVLIWRSLPSSVLA